MKKLIITTCTLVFCLAFSSHLQAQQSLGEKIDFANRMVSYSQRDLAAAHSDNARAKARLVLKMRQIDLDILRGNDRSDELVETIQEYNTLNYNIYVDLKSRGLASTQEVLKAEFKLVNGLMPNLKIPLSFPYN